MRVLFTPHVATQHLYPIVPLAWACRAAGHEVRIVGNPALADVMARTGLPAVVVGADMPPPNHQDDAAVFKTYQHRRFPPDWPLCPELLDDEQRAVIELLGRRSAATAEYTVDNLIEYARSWRPDVVVHDIGNFTGPVAATVLGVPNVRHLTGVGLRPMELRVDGRHPLPEFVALFERRGLQVRVPTLSIDPSPPSLRLPVTAPWREMRYVPFNGTGSLPSWLRVQADRPRVCITWGLSVSRLSQRLNAFGMAPLRLAVDALSTLDVEVVLAAMADQLEKLGPVPGNVRPVHSVPLHQLLPTCSLIVHQAGDGTSLTACAAGVPQLPITRKPDPALTGGRLAAVGAAIHLRYQELEPEPDAHEVVRTAAQKLLTDPSYLDAAARLRREMERQPAPNELVPVLETLAGKGR